MPSTPKQLEVAERDGTSQAWRALAALAPDYVAVDETTSEALLRFARAYGRELTYYGPDGQPHGDWSGFIGPDLPLGALQAFLREPDKGEALNTPALFRPHLVLFLVFLKLLESVRAEVNTLTGRHLSFYFRQILRMSTRPAIPDRVNLIADLRAGSQQALLPAGTRLNAGPDSQGYDQIYVTDRDLVVNRAQIQRMMSLFFD